MAPFFASSICNGRAVSTKVSEQRVAEIRRFLTEEGIRREADELQHLSRFLAAFPDATLREVYIAGFGLILHVTFEDDIERARMALLRKPRPRVGRDGDHA